MSKHLGVSLLLALVVMLAACAPAAAPVRTPTQLPPTPTRPIEMPATPVPVDVSAPTIENNRLLLARQLRVDPATIQVIAVEKVEWSDSCLGLGQANESCAAVVTPGYKITFSVAGQEYVIHTDEGGSQVRVASAPTPEIGERIITWSGPLDMVGLRGSHHRRGGCRLWPVLQRGEVGRQIRQRSTARRAKTNGCEVRLVRGQQ